MSNHRNILVSAVGLNPQVITETLYCFLCRAKPQLPITEVFALITLPGKNAINKALFGKNFSRIDMLCQDYELPPIQFDNEHIYILQSADGQELEDIWSAKDNEAVANQIFAFIREKTSDSSVRLHAFIAGGRKTMGLYLGLAMQFYGRPGDTLSHVLVNQELESDPNFFYPPPNTSTIRLANGDMIPAEQIRLEITYVPLLLLREKIPFLADRSEFKYSDLIRIAQMELDGLQILLPVRLDRLSRSLGIGDIQIKLTALQFALYLIFAEKRMQCEDRCPGCERCGFSLSQIEGGLLQPLLKSKLGEMGCRDPRYLDLQGWGSSDASGETPKTRLFETLSRIRRRIRVGLGFASWACQYSIERQTPRNEEGLYCISVFPGRIEIV
jgi:CRISPR-associated protein (TIGR02584 family)